MAKEYMLRKDNTIQEKASLIPIIKEVDVIVAGGGTSGLMAAVSAARNGAKTLLIELSGVLGGTGTASLMTVLCGTSWAEGLSRELIDRIQAAGGAPAWNETEENIPFDALGRGAINMNRSQSTPFDPEVYKRIALEMATDAGVELLFYSLVCDAIIENGVIKGVIVENKQGRQAILSKVVVDCTGDADVSVRAGADYVVGREKDSKMRPITLLFRMGGLDLHTLIQWAEENPDQIQPLHRKGQILKVNNEHVVARLSGFYDLCETAQIRGELSKEIHYLRFENAWIERGMSLVNSTRIYDVDGTDPWDLTKARLSADRQIQELVLFIRKYLPGCQHAFVIDTASFLGVRETRRIVGEYVLSNEDIFNNARFPDAVMGLRRHVPKRGLEYIQAHPAEPIEGSKEDIYERDPASIPYEKHHFEIPLRCLLPKGIDNLIVAGRCISVTHDIDSTTRNQLICMRMGQVAGTVAALASQEGTIPSKINIRRLRALAS